MSKDVIFLIGYMGCGKSTMGIQLARSLDYEFIDLDNYIETKEKLTISEIFQKYEEAYFRNIETLSLNEISKSTTKAVISTGGGTPCFNNNIATMNNSGLTIYIKIELDELVKRLMSQKSLRPLLAKFSEDEMKNYISKHLEEREVYYKQAKIIFANATHDALLNVVQSTLNQI